MRCRKSTKKYILISNIYIYININLNILKIHVKAYFQFFINRNFLCRYKLRLLQDISNKITHGIMFKTVQRFPNLHNKIPFYDYYPFFLCFIYLTGRNFTCSVFSDVCIWYNPTLRARYSMSGSQRGTKKNYKNQPIILCL